MTKPRTGIPGHPELRGVVNRSAWGEVKATERYGGGTKTFPPEDLNANKPQKLGDASNQQGNYYDDDVRNDWRRGNGMKPNWDPGFKGKR
jgi:hypothetical protein